MAPATAPPDSNRLTPGQTAAAIAAGVLCLWIPFTLVIGLLVDTVPNCAESRAAICTPLGHLAGTCAGTAGAVLGLAVVVIGSWVRPRRYHAHWAVVGLTVAAAGFLIVIGLLGSAPGE